MAAASHTSHGTRTVLALLAGIALGWFARTVWPADSGAPETGEEAAQLRPADMSVSVSTAKAIRADLPLVVSAAGVVRAAPASERQLSTRGGGRVLATLVVPGQQVHAGELLLRLDPLPLSAALAQARARLARSANALAEFDQVGRARRRLELAAAAKAATSQHELLVAQAERIAQLHAEGLSSDKALAEARAAAETARADSELAAQALDAFDSSSADRERATLLVERDAAQAAVDEAERQLAEAEVPAPADGQVLEFDARAGARLDPGQVFGKLLAQGTRRVEFGVTPAAAAGLALGARASWDDARGGRATGRLVSVGAEVEPGTGLRTALVEYDPDVPPDPPGLAVRGEIEHGRLERAVLVPERAVLRAHDRQVVVLVKAGRAQVVPVTVMGRHAGLAAVAGEVAPGDEVIVEGGYNLPDGAAVLVAPAPGP